VSQLISLFASDNMDPNQQREKKWNIQT